MDYEKSYKEAINKLQEALSQTDGHEISGLTRRCIEEIFPELKETEKERDERVRKELLEHCKNLIPGSEFKKHQSWVAWLEKQGEQNGSAKEAPASCALSFINYLDAHRYIGKMCMSNGECEDIENAFHNGMWDKLHRYYCKYIEKQGEQKPVKWGVEDLSKVQRICQYLNEAKKYYADLTEVRGCIDWLKSIGDRIEGEVSCATKEEELNAEQDSTGITDIMKQEFKTGDWIVFGNGMVGQISDVQEDGYIGRDTDGWYFALSKPEGNSNAHLWTIEDAKDGDVLYKKGFYGDCIFIFNGLDRWKFDEPNEDRAVATGYCCLTLSGNRTEFGTQGPDCIEVDTIIPATKEQRDALFQKMKEAGYEWDSQNKSLSKI